MWEKEHNFSNHNQYLFGYNNLISHVQSCDTSNLTWKILKRLCQSQDVIFKMYFKDKIHILKLKKNDSITKHIDLFQANLNQLAIAWEHVLNNEIIIFLMKSTPPSYKAFISYLQRQLSLALQSLISNLIQEETWLKDMNQNNDKMSTPYMGKSHFHLNKGPSKLNMCSIKR